MPPEQFDSLGSYFYPGTDVLKNKLGIRDGAELRRAEYEITAHRLEAMRRDPVPGNLDLDHLKAIHREVFQDVYEWAGEIRTVGIAKGSSTFARPEYIESEGRRLSLALAKENRLQGLDKATFADRLAEHYADWNALHPFREGNGRSTREFMGAIARQAGYELDQDRIEAFKDEWNKAAARAHGGDMAGVRQIFKESLRPSRAVAFQALPEAEAVRRHPELAEAFAKLRINQAEQAMRHPTNPQAQQHFGRAQYTEIVRRLDAGQLVELTPEQRTNHAAARAFLRAAPADAVKEHPRLVGPLATVGAYGAALQGQGVAEEQRRQAVEQMRAALAQQILAGKYPAVRTEQLRFPNAPDRDTAQDQDRPELSQ